MTTKLPFGGFDAGDTPIDWDAEPEPLMKEIAKCAEEGIAMRPNLAAWFHRMYEAKAIKVTVRKKRGARSKDDPRKRRWALRKILRLVRSGLPIDQAVAQVRAEVGLRSQHETVRAWYYEYRAEQDAQWAEWLEDARDEAIKLFTRLHNEGVPAKEALDQVMYREYLPLRLRDASLFERWQDEAIYRATNGSPGK